MFSRELLQMVPGVEVKERQPGGAVKGQNGFILRMDGSQYRSELPQERHSSRLVVYKHSSLAAGRDLTLYNDVAVFRLHAVLFQHRLQSSFVGFKYATDHRFLCSVPN